MTALTGFLMIVLIVTTAMGRTGSPRGNGSGYGCQ